MCGRFLISEIPQSVILQQRARLSVWHAPNLRTPRSVIFFLQLARLSEWQCTSFEILRLIMLLQPSRFNVWHLPIFTTLWSVILLQSVRLSVWQFANSFTLASVTLQFVISSVWQSYQFIHTDVRYI